MASFKCSVALASVALTAEWIVEENIVENKGRSMKLTHRQLKGRLAKRAFTKLFWENYRWVQHPTDHKWDFESHCFVPVWELKFQPFIGPIYNWSSALFQSEPFIGPIYKRSLAGPRAPSWNPSMEISLEEFCNPDPTC